MHEKFEIFMKCLTFKTMSVMQSGIFQFKTPIKCLASKTDMISAGTFTVVEIYIKCITY